MTLFYDITVPFTNNMDVWEGDPPFQRQDYLTIDSDGCNVSSIQFGSHTGTHIDAPLHYISGGKSVDQIEFQKLIGICYVLDISTNQFQNNLIPSNIIPDNLKKNVHKILFKTLNSFHPGKFNKNSISLSLEAAQKLVQLGFDLIGIDGMSIESYSGDGSVHTTLLSHNIVILETIDLSNISSGYYSLTCLPLKLIGSDGSPARAILQSS